jgi:hypothetical protein
LKIEYNGDTSAEGRGILTIKWRNFEVNKFIFFGIVLFWSMSASATLIGFEGVAPSGGEMDFNPYSESGYNFATDNTFPFRIISSSHSTFSSNLTAPSGDFGYIQTPSTIITITDPTSSLFSLHSLDTGIVFGPIINTTLTVDGILASGNTISTSLAISDVTSTSGSFQHFVFDSSWTNLRSVNFTLAANSNFLGIDNVQLTTVPLPAAFWLLAIGLLGLTGISKRKTV